ncbi:hypothetical protein LUZ62_089328 [Rhynchospora pubera]|uniref:Uncharacterized protein n=1 Tax=Rhynchospora pubera TaxID=906938 RepID=A0AAV8CI91_9POAL|nr:hypothetical protein LUZ62_089328 [Rhynchospora pubera]
MARILAQTLTLVHKRAQSLAQKSLVPSSLLLHRAQSSRSGKNNGELIEGDLIEIEIRSNLPEEDHGTSESDLESDSDTRSTVLGIKRLEDAIQGVIVKRSAPDWLPFVPGASYWVPPFRKPMGVMELVSRVANERGEMVVMSEEESLSFTSVRGYPSSTYFLEGGPPHPVKKRSRKVASQTDDEES